MKSDTVHIGVDVSKEKLDIYVPPQGGGRAETKQLDNGIAGFRMLRDLARKAGATVCVEPTGGYELELIAFMHKFGVAVAYADARTPTPCACASSQGPRGATPKATGSTRR